MNHGQNSLEKLVFFILREDGSLKVDLLRDICQIPCFDTLEAGEPIIVALRYLTLRDAFRAFIDPPGNVGEGHLKSAVKALTFAYQYLEKSKTPETNLCLEQILAALSRALDDIVCLRDIQCKIDELLTSDDPNARLEESVRQLVHNCQQAETREVCSSLGCSFWLAWVTAWALRLSCIEGNSIAELKQLYSQSPWLDRRVGDRKELRPPGGLLDPDEQQEAMDLVLF